MMSVQEVTDKHNLKVFWSMSYQNKFLI